MLILIGGGSCSGKTTLVKNIMEIIGGDMVSVINTDYFYYGPKDNNKETLLEYNFDTIDSINCTELISAANELKNGKEFQYKPFDYKLHKRSSDNVIISPKKYIIIEGLFALSLGELLKLSDFKVFVWCEEEVKFARRFVKYKDVFGQSSEFIIKKYIEQVKPAFDVYIKPKMKLSDLIINGCAEPRKQAENMIEILQH